MKQTGYVNNGMLSGTYAGWVAVMLNLVSAAAIGVFLYGMRIW